MIFITIINNDNVFLSLIDSSLQMSILFNWKLCSYANLHQTNFPNTLRLYIQLTLLQPQNLLFKDSRHTQQIPRIRGGAASVP